MKKLFIFRNSKKCTYGTFSLELECWNTTIKNRSSTTKFILKFAMTKLWINYYHFVPCVIELFIAVSDNVSCVFWKARATHIHTRISYAQANAITFFSCVFVCAFYLAAWTLLSRMLCAWNQMIHTSLFFLQQKQSDSNFLLAFQIYLINVPTTFCLDLIPFRYIRFPEKLWLKISILEIKKKDFAVVWLVPRLSSVELKYDADDSLKGSESFLLLLAKPIQYRTLYQLNVIQWVDNRKLLCTVAKY